MSNKVDEAKEFFLRPEPTEEADAEAAPPMLNPSKQAESIESPQVAIRTESRQQPPEEETAPQVDLIDEAFMAMGGFGKLQKISYFMNTLINGGAALFIYCFVFLEKEPVYECLEGTEWKECTTKAYCALPEAERSIDWHSQESLHNLIETFKFYCEPSAMIGLIGAAFLMGVVIGSLTLTRLGDVHGRRPIFMLGLVMHLGFMAGIMIVTNYILCYVLVFIFGLSLTARYYVGYAYNVEMQPKSHYVLVGTSMFLVESVAYLSICFYFMYASQYWKPLQIPNIVFISAGVVFLCFMPESPRFLISKRRFEDARDVFKWIGKVNGLSREEAERRLDEIVFDGEDREYKDPNPEAAFSTLLKDAQLTDSQKDKSKDQSVDRSRASGNAIPSTIEYKASTPGREAQSFSNPQNQLSGMGEHSAQSGKNASHFVDPHNFKSARKSRASAFVPHRYGASFGGASEKGEREKSMMQKSFVERMGLSNRFDGSFNKRATHTYNMQSSFVAPVLKSIITADPTENLLAELWKVPQLRQNLIASCFTWLFASFNFYLITFYLKYFPGSIFINSICFAFADMIAFTSSGIFLQWVSITQGIVIANCIGLVGGVAYLVYIYVLEDPSTSSWAIPLVVCVSRMGGAMCFNIGYVSVARLFPTQYVATVFGVVNFVAHCITIGAPMVAEFPQPIPMSNFCVMSALSIIAATWLEELPKPGKSRAAGRASVLASIKAAADEQSSEQ